ncbi:helix-turn-helix domain-containing protein [Streptomyces sp. NPDC051218]|uniref:helix-turn-helix domain-containing protein n=1 Tax=Streptomyces sp. NPDC051218 TaxID=3365645 RepID=UPI0037B24CF1
MQIIKRPLGTLRVISTAENGVSLKDVGDGLGVPFSSMHRIAAVFEERGRLSRLPAHRRCFLSPAAPQLVGEDHAEQALTGPHEVVQEMQRRTGEAVFLTEVLGEHVVCTAGMQASLPPLAPRPVRTANAAARRRVDPGDSGGLERGRGMPHAGQPIARPLHENHAEEG